MQVRKKTAAVLGCVALAAVSVGFGIWCFSNPGDASEGSPGDDHRAKTPRYSNEPPQPNLEGVDPAVVVAVKKAREAVRRSPNSADAWGTLAQTLLAHAFYEQAATSFGRAADCDPDNPRWPYLQALAVERRDLEGAVPLLKTATKLCNDRPDAPRLRLVEVLIELDRIEEAQQVLEPLVSREPTNAWARLLAGRIAFYNGDFDECLDHLRVAKMHRAGKEQAAALMAKVYLRQGKPDISALLRNEAAKAPKASWSDPYLREAMAMQTGVKAMLVKADVAFGTGKVDKAIEILQQARAEYPDSLWARIHLGRAWIRQRKLVEAEQVLHEALKLSPQSVEAIFRMGVTLHLQGRREEALERCREAIKLKPDFTMAHYNLGCWLRLAGDGEGAIEAFGKAVECDSELYEARAMLGDVLAEQGRHDEARTHLRRALELKPGSSFAKRLLDQLPPSDPEAEPD